MTEPRSDDQGTFADLGLVEPLLRAVDDAGYESPSPIQQRVIPLLLEGRDVIGQAQTGTGKTAAFILPILQQIDLSRAQVQALVLAPTRELAIQVSEATYTYARHLGGLRVAPIYGGQSIEKQIGRLRKGLHIVVGTPGRVMDHLRRGALDLSALRFVVLDEADEMLRMGFLEDVTWILSQAPQQVQKALFSATMPQPIRRVADQHLRDPITVETAHKTLTVPAAEQRFMVVAESQKLDALTRILETEVIEGALVFVRTRLGAADLAEKLDARGYAVRALHGDMNQAQREAVMRQMRQRQIETVVATDVAARGLDVEHISHVINYDIPYDSEAYVHRIGRTARAGRSGAAILFVTPRQKRLLHEIERYTGQRMQPMKLPTEADVAARRVALFKESILNTLQERAGELPLYLELVEALVEESGCDVAEVAAASAYLAHEGKPLVVPVEPEPDAVPQPEEGMVRLFIDAGRENGVRPADIVGAIANEAGIPGKAIGAIDIFDRFTYVELPAQYRDQVLQRMSDAMIRSRPANIRPATAADRPPTASRKGPGPRPTSKRRGRKKPPKRRT